MVVFLTIIQAPALAGLGEPSQVLFAPDAAAFPLVHEGRAAPLAVDAGDWAGVRRAVADLQKDIEHVTRVAPLFDTTVPPASAIVIVGTVGHSALIDELVRAGKIDVTPIRGKWEAWLTDVVSQPFPGVEYAWAPQSWPYEDQTGVAFARRVQCGQLRRGCTCGRGVEGSGDELFQADAALTEQ